MATDDIFKKCHPDGLMHKILSSFSNTLLLKPFPTRLADFKKSPTGGKNIENLHNDAIDWIRQLICLYYGIEYPNHHNHILYPHTEYLHTHYLSSLKLGMWHPPSLPQYSIPRSFFSSFSQDFPAFDQNPSLIFSHLSSLDAYTLFLNILLIRYIHSQLLLISPPLSSPLLSSPPSPLLSSSSPSPLLRLCLYPYSTLLELLTEINQASLLSPSLSPPLPLASPSSVSEITLPLPLLLAITLQGITNNIGYCILNSHATDIASSGWVLLANITPAVIFKFFVNFFNFIPLNQRFLMVGVLGLISLFAVSNVESIPLRLLAIALMSISSGLGESFSLSLLSYLPGSSLSAWGGGTGLAGLVGTAYPHFMKKLIPRWNDRVMLGAVFVVMHLLISPYISREVSRRQRTGERLETQESERETPEKGETEGRSLRWIKVEPLVETGSNRERLLVPSSPSHERVGLVLGETLVVPSSDSPEQRIPDEAQMERDRETWKDMAIHWQGHISPPEIITHRSTPSYEELSPRVLAPLETSEQERRGEESRVEESRVEEKREAQGKGEEGVLSNVETSPTDHITRQDPNSSPLESSPEEFSPLPPASPVTPTPASESAPIPIKQLVELIPKELTASFLVYFSQYFINAGLYAHIAFPSIEKKDFYTLASFLYQVGCFPARLLASYVLGRINPAVLWPFPLLQGSIALLFIFQVLLSPFPLGLVGAMVVMEGLVAGSTYVRTVAAVRARFADLKVRSETMAFLSVANSVGTAIAAVLAIVVEPYLKAHTS